LTEVRVHVQLGGRTVAAGVAYFTVGRGGVSTTFVYDPAYLANREGHDLEPAMPRRSGQQYTDALPRSFADCAPDRWGRSLIDKRRRALQGQAPQRLPSATEIDYLLGVSDLTRQGALRFTVGDGPFLDPQDAVPKLVSLPRLLAAADEVESKDTQDDLAAVKALLDAGSGSLGGARPKASVRGNDGALLIAKFPHRDDEWDVMAWEKTALDLAESAGLRVPRRRLTKVGARNVLLIDRFDRGPQGTRRGYISAMTLLEARDGDERDYVDIAEGLSENGAQVNDDLAELFSRVAFNVAIHNTDDHLRNHGFLRSPGGWSLSPVFDVNPNPDLGRRRVTSVAGVVDVDDEVDALPVLAQECRLSAPRTRAAVGRVHAAVSQWRAVSAANGVATAEQHAFAEVFAHGLGALEAISG
jgi:serine/threonine-protein kinase HipA